jgi:hypothetical protein
MNNYLSLMFSKQVAALAVNADLIECVAILANIRQPMMIPDALEWLVNKKSDRRWGLRTPRTYVFQ